MDVCHSRAPSSNPFQFVKGDDLDAFVQTECTTFGQVKIVLKQQQPALFFSSQSDFVRLLLHVKEISEKVQYGVQVVRCALLADGLSEISIYPLHGLDDRWEPIKSKEKVFYEHFPGFLTSEDAPQMAHERLNKIRDQIAAKSGLTAPYNTEFHGDESDDNIFARIVRGDLEQWRIWEDEKHVAFLTPFPNTPGFTVLIPRAHLSSDIMSLEKDAYADLMRAAHTTGNILIDAFPDVEECGMIFEGYEIDYAHVKLLPVHVSKIGPSRQQLTETIQQQAKGEDYQETYQGFITSKPGPPYDNMEDLEALASRLRDSL